MSKKLKLNIKLANGAGIDPDKVVYCNKGWQHASYGLCPSEKAWKREMKRLNTDDAIEQYPFKNGKKALACVKTLDDEIGHRVILVCVCPDAEKDHSAYDLLDMLVHESMHVWQRMREHMGETHPGHEQEAYAMQHIFRNLLDAFMATRGKELKWPT